MNTQQMKRYKISHLLGSIFSTVGKIFVCFIFVFPFYWMITTAFKTYKESIQFPPTLWPHEFTLEGFRTVFEGLNLTNYLKNSVIIIICIIVIQMITMVPAAYAFAKYEFKGKGVMFGLVMMAFMIPTQVTFITVYLMFSKMGVMRTLLPQILPFGANAFGIFMLRQNFKQIPEELIESARLDEAGEIQIMVQIMLPMAKSTMVTVALLSFISHWNAYFWPLVMTISEDQQPLTMAIARLRDLEWGDIWPTIMAGNTLLVLPVLILFLFGSKRIIQAMAYRGIK